MEENLHNIDKIFRDSIEEHKELPSQRVWNAIDRDLDKNKIKNINRKYTRLKRLSFLLLLLLLSFVIYDLVIKHPGDKIADRSDSSVINKKEVSENNSGTSPNREPGKGNGNLAGETARETKNIKDEDKPLRARDNVRIRTISDIPAIDKKNITTPMEADNERRNGNRASNKTATALDKHPNLTTGFNKKEEKKLIDDLHSNDKETTKQAVIISFSIAKTEKPALQSLLVAKKMILVPGKSMAENGKSRHLEQSRFSATIFFSPDFPSYRLQKNPPHNQSLDNIKEAEKPDLSTTTGIWIDYKLNDHWRLQSGASYSNAIILIDPKTIYAEQDNNTGDVKYRFNASSGYGYLLPSFANSPTIGDSLYAFTSTHTLRYLNIPLAVKYDLSKGKFNFFGSAGMSSNILLEGIIETVVKNNSYNESEVIDRLHGLKKIYFSGLLSIGAEYKLSNKFSLMISPAGRFALNSINNKDAPVKSYPNSMGILTGIRMNF